MVLCRQLATGGQLTLHLHIVSRTWEVAAVSLDVRVKILCALLISHNTVSLTVINITCLHEGEGTQVLDA